MLGREVLWEEGIPGEVRKYLTTRKKKNSERACEKTKETNDELGETQMK